MSKIICDICGTSYPETSTQCPICGCVRPAQAAPVSESEQEEGYTYVKGGRFSKSNVKKRNQGIAMTKVSPKAPAKEKKTVNKKLIGLIIVVACLVLIFSLLGWFIYSAINNSEDEPKNDPVETVDIPCTGIKLAVRSFEIKSESDSLNISVTCSPVNTTDKLTFTSSDPNVVAVDVKGNVTYVGNGKADIIVECGEISDKCTITCNVPDSTEPTEPEGPEETTAPAKPIRFLTGLIQTTDYYQCEVGATYNLYVGEVPVGDIIWTSDDSKIAEIRDGVVYMKGNGTTTVYAEYGDQKLSCTVIVGSSDDFNLLPPGTDVDMADYKSYICVGYWVNHADFSECYLDNVKYSPCIDVTLADGQNLTCGLYKEDTGAEIVLHWKAVFDDESVSYDEETDTFTRNSDVPRDIAIYMAQYGDETIYLYIR